VREFFITTVFIVSSIFCADIFAYEIESSASAGLKYDTTAGDSTLLERITSVDNNPQGALFLDNSFMTGVSIFDGSYSFDYALSSASALGLLTASKLNQYFEFSINFQITDSLFMQPVIQFHHAAKDYSSFKNFYFDSFLYLNLIYDLYDNFSLFGLLKAGYYKNIDNEIDFFEGPSLGVETGFFIYPAADPGYLKIALGANYFSFRNLIVRFLGENENLIVGISNKFIENFAVLEIKKEIKPFTLFLDMKYSFVISRKKDQLTYIANNIEQTKRKTEHSISLSPSALLEISRYLDGKIHYSFIFTKSNIGIEINDYTKQSEINHITGFDLILGF